MNTQSLLVELFAEELPPKALKKLGELFAASLAASLQAQGLSDAHAVVTPFAIWKNRRPSCSASSLRNSGGNTARASSPKPRW